MNVEKICLALDIGATNIKYAAVTSSMKLEGFQVVPTDRAWGPDGLVKQVCEIYESLIGERKGAPVGISCAGPLDPVQGRLLIPANLTDGKSTWSNFPLVGEIQKKLGVEVALENDAAAAALGEICAGKGKNVPDFMVLTLGTGLGTGVVRDGHIVRVAGGLHTELGHLIVNVDDTHRPDGSRVKGSLEAVIGPKFFLNRFSELRGKVTTGQEYIELLKAKDQQALGMVEPFQEYLLAGLFNFYLAFAPQIYIFQGGFSPLIELIQKDLEEKLDQKLKGFIRPGTPTPKIEISEISRTCGVYGAALRIFQQTKTELTKNE